MSNFNQELAIGLNTFIRDANLKRFIASCQTFYPELKIYIIEQGRISEEKEKFYDYLRNEGHVIHQIPFDSGISYAREELRKIVKEKYLMYMQDDFIITNDTKIYNMLHVLKSDPALGVVCGGLISCRKTIEKAPETPIIHGNFLHKCDKALLYTPIEYLFKLGLLEWRHTRCKGLRYVYCDMSWDFSMWNLEAQKDIFDEKVHVIEHSHVYLSIKRQHKWKVAYTPESIIVHTHDRSNKEYDNFRKRKDDIDYLLNYWNIDNMVTSLKEYKWLPSLNAIKASPTYENIIPERMTEVTDNPVEQTISVPSNLETPIISSHSSKVLSEFVNILKIAGKNCYLRERTCWEAIVKHSIMSSPLYVSISKLSEENIKYLMDNGFVYLAEQKVFSKHDCFIVFNYKLPEKNKAVVADGYEYLVPLPAHKYLESLYGVNWKMKTWTEK